MFDDILESLIKHEIKAYYINLKKISDAEKLNAKKENNEEPVYVNNI